MLSILLIDDEDLELDGLEAMINGLAMDVSVCGRARNGIQGIEIAAKLHPDVILSDVKMPRMDGIEMAKKLRDAGEDSFLVFISGYQDFSAAQEAIALGAGAYLLKPVNCESLKKVLIQAGGKVLKREREQAQRTRLVEQEEKLSYLKKQSDMKKLLLKQTLTDQERKELAKQIPIPFDDGWFAVEMAETKKLQEEYYFENELPAELLEEVKDSQLLPPVLFASGRVVFLLNYPAMLPEKTVTEYLMETGERLAKCCAVLWNEAGLRIYASGPTRELAEIPTLMEQANRVSKEPRQAGALPVVFYEEQPDTLTMQAVRTVEQIIRTEYGTPLSVDEIAERVYLSPSHISRMFKKQTGETILDYLQSVRMSKALELLREPGYKIHEIADLTGYGNASYFGMVFRKFYGETPGKYRERLHIYAAGGEQK